MAENIPDRIRWFLPLLFLATGIILCFNLRHAPIGDFGNYYFGSKLWINNTPSSVLYDACSFNERIRKEPGMADEKFFLNYTPVPPVSLLFYAPLTWMPWQEAKLVFNLVGILVFCLALYRVLPLIPGRPLWIILLPFVFLPPLKSNLQEGQAYLFIASFLVECFLSGKRSFRAAFFLALAVSLKLFPLVIILYFIASRQNNTALLTVVFFLLLSIGGGWVAGMQTVGYYWMDVVPRLMQNEINDPYAINYQTVFVWLKNLLVGDDLLNPYPLVHAPLLFVLISGMLTGLFFFLAFQAMKKEKDTLLSFSVALILGFVASAYSSTYSLFLLIFPAVVLPGHSRDLKAALFLFLLCVVPVYSLASLPTVFHFLKAIFLLLFFFTWLPSLNSIWQWKPAIVTIVVFLGIRWGMYEPPADNSSYLASRNPDMLLCNYRVGAGNILLEGYDEHGAVTDSVPAMVQLNSDCPITIDHGQIKDGNEIITSGNDLKRQPLCYDDSLVIYLSDRNRGVGFYALRKIPRPAHATQQDGTSRE